MTRFTTTEDNAIKTYRTACPGQSQRGAAFNLYHHWYAGSSIFPNAAVGSITSRSEASIYGRLRVLDKALKTEGAAA